MLGIRRPFQSFSPAPMRLVSPAFSSGEKVEKGLIIPQHNYELF